MDDIKLISLDETDSTNRFLREYRGEEGRRMTVAVAEYQTNGRGQGTNSWESERGKNLTFSLKTYPKDVPANRQFVMLEAMALSIRDVLSAYTDHITIKWPNDIYWRDRKISGTLSECALSKGVVKGCIIGTGININQTEFTSDAPNPVSLRQITGRETKVDEVLYKLTTHFSRQLERIDAGDYDDIHEAYLAALYRRSGTFRYRDSGGEFCGTIITVEPSGHLVLRKESGEVMKYAFKEVEYLL